ncbi:uncharacterized protein HMPREF1541_07315 [Cyphellophora europaea CBS 101466]|uniref:Phosphoribulokinase/uridine kinase domain-containing protein n=1 Tax=Cyphellophora europaea (strain CBS 101466) TaxID=1220924 RepID=W2RMI1_CYPE1|nr:uncharacterized protein HMPREF1541_07315 [Cyphellophora europaea CBS 101466]ETN37692.1 hypothetical protein HMPREF1541_07315 [Cyphellophora europaea CBS 101466]
MATTTQPFTPLLIGLSGPSSSGKTTLARLLHRVFNAHPATPTTHHRSITLFILHEDDFYKTDAAIPLITTGPSCPSGLGSRTLQDWDCLGSLDLPLFRQTMRHVRTHGTLPPDSHSKEDQNSVGPVDIPPELPGRLRAEVAEWLANLPLRILPAGQELRVCVLDGFLLYPSPEEEDDTDADADGDVRALRAVAALLDVKLLLLASRAQTVARRTRRAGYVTLEGFWQDPEGYVEDVVWPNYVRDLGWVMREGRGVDDGVRGKEGKGMGMGMVDVDEGKAEGEALRVAPGRGEWDLGALLVWAVGEVRRGVEARRELGG